jgi:two-component system cell cycle sensor histidine kinase/response regulator CckA
MRRISVRLFGSIFGLRPRTLPVSRVHRLITSNPVVLRGWEDEALRGLGLATCRTIVQQSGGHIDVSSEIGEGTTFKIFLPRIKQPLKIATEPVQSIPLLQGGEALRDLGGLPPRPSEPAHRILVVDDDVSVRQLTTEMLIRAGFAVDAAADGAAGWEALQAKHYDLIITDNFMPNVTGIEMVKKIHAGSMNLPVIMATAIFPQEEFQLHPWLESIPTLLKPFRATELLSTVRKVLSANEGSRQQIAPKN